LTFLFEEARFAKDLPHHFQIPHFVSGIDSAKRNDVRFVVNGNGIVTNVYLEVLISREHDRLFVDVTLGHDGRLTIFFNDFDLNEIEASVENAHTLVLHAVVETLGVNRKVLAVNRCSCHD